MTPEVAVRADNIFFVSGDRIVLDDVSLELESKKIFGLLGESEGGKSVLLKILSGIMKPNSGRVTIRSRGGGTSNEEVVAQPRATPVTGLVGKGESQQAEHLHGKNSWNDSPNKFSIGFMFQEGALFDSLSVLDNVAFPLQDGKVPLSLSPYRVRKNITERVASILTKVGLLAAINKMPGQLSGGMRRRVSLARALVASPEILFLDDPTSGLDPISSQIIMDLIVEVHESLGATTVVISHDLRRLLPVADEIIALFGGKIIFKGSLSFLRDGIAKGSRYNSQPSDSTFPKLANFIGCRFEL